jgi:dolichyl-diphosphooligosaccharide--protein glycosyltransferase
VTRARVASPFVLAVAAILLLAFWARVSVAPAMFATGELVPSTDGDSHYHLGRILDAVAHFPSVRHFDPLMNWPAGAFCPWADGYDLGGAAFALLLGGGDPLRQIVAAALWPVVLGLLVVVATVALVQAAFPGPGWRSAALAAGVAAALIPVGASTSGFGRVDHHVFEALLLALLARWSLRRLPTRRGAPAPSDGPLRFELEGALLSALGVYGFNGAAVYVAVAALPLAWAAFADRRLLGSGGPGLVVGGLLAAALDAPAMAEHHLLLSFKYPSLLQPGLLVLAGGGIMVAALIASAAAARWRGRGLVALVLLLAVVAAIAARSYGEVRGAISGWLLQQDRWIAGIAEFKPLLALRRDGSSPWTGLHSLMGGLGFLLPVTAGAVVVRFARRPRALGLVWFTMALVGLTLLQARFVRPLVPLAAACAGVAFALLVRWLARPRRVGRSLLTAPALLALLALADPPSRALVRWIEVPAAEPVQEMAGDLRERPLGEGVGRGVLSNWSSGHQLEIQARVPVAVNGFGSYLDEAAFWRAVNVFGGEVEPFDRYLTEQRFGGVVAGAATIGREMVGAGQSRSFDRGNLDRNFMASVPLSPLLIAGSAVPGWGVRHLPHLMPRHASAAGVPGLAFPLPQLWTFERVAGARVRGTAPARSSVLAELRFTEHQRPHTYRAFTEAGMDGSWELVLPFPTGLIRPALRSAPAWSVAASSGVARWFAVDEETVRRGATIEVGALRGPT